MRFVYFLLTVALESISDASCNAKCLVEDEQLLRRALWNLLEVFITLPLCQLAFKNGNPQVAFFLNPPQTKERH